MKGLENSVPNSGVYVLNGLGNKISCPYYLNLIDPDTEGTGKCRILESGIHSYARGGSDEQGWPN